MRLRTRARHAAGTSHGRSATRTARVVEMAAGRGTVQSNPLAHRVHHRGFLAHISKLIEQLYRRAQLRPCSAGMMGTCAVVLPTVRLAAFAVTVVHRSVTVVLLIVRLAAFAIDG